MHLLALISLLGLALGIFLGEQSAYASEIVFLTFLILFFQIIILIVLYKKRTVKKEGRGVGDISLEYVVGNNRVALLTIFFCLFLAIGIIRIQFIEEKHVVLCESICTFSGTINALPKMQNNYQTFSVTPDGMDSVYDVQVKSILYPKYKEGNRVILTGKVLSPKNSPPKVGERFFDYDRYLKMHGIGSTMTYPKIESLAESEKEKSSLASHLVDFRDSCLSLISKYGSEPSSSLSSGMLFGADSLSSELVQTFRATGLSHIVVLSGFNIALLSGFVLLLFAFMPLILRIIFASVFITLFVFMVGAEASIIRATIMSFVALLALLLGRAYVARQSLIISLIVISLYEPLHLLYDVSLHLSFLASAGIIYMSDGIKRIFFVNTFSTSKEIFVTTLSAYSATLPYVMYTFGSVSLYSLIANIIILPLVPVVMFVTFLVILTAPFLPYVANLLGYIATLLGNIIILVARFIESLPFSYISVSIHMETMVLIYVCAGLLFYFYVNRFSFVTKNETSITKDNEIISEIISY